jgi:hypothetical protein
MPCTHMSTMHPVYLPYICIASAPACTLSVTRTLTRNPNPNPGTVAAHACVLACVSAPPPSERQDPPPPLLIPLLTAGVVSHAPPPHHPAPHHRPVAPLQPAFFLNSCRARPCRMNRTNLTKIEANAPCRLNCFALHPERTHLSIYA